MSGDDYLTTMDALLNPAQQALREIDALNGSGMVKSWAKQARDAERFASGLLPDVGLSSLRAAEQRALGATDALSTCADANGWLSAIAAASATRGIAAELSLISGASWATQFATKTLDRSQLADSVVGLVDPSRVIGEMTRHWGAPLPGYAALWSQLDDPLEMMRGGAIGREALAAIERDFAQLSQAARFLDPMRHLGTAWSGIFDGALTVPSLLAQLEYGSALRDRWLEPYLQLEQLVADALQQLDASVARDVESDARDMPPDDDALVDEADAPVELTARELASRLAVPHFQLTLRLRAIAARVDPSAAGGVASWDRMLLAIGYAAPGFARELMTLAYPLLHHFSVLFAPAGRVISGHGEALRSSDIDAFEELAGAMLGLLDAIERSIGDAGDP